MDIKLVRELVSIMNANSLLELEIEEKGVTIRLRKAGDKVEKEIVAIPSAVPMPVGNGAPLAPPAVEPAPPPVPAAPEGPSPETITSPMVGTFYRAPSPDADPFVAVGDAVDVDTTIGIIEAMKIMNDIPAGKKGVIREFLVIDHESVEYGQPIAVLESVEE